MEEWIKWFPDGLQADAFELCEMKQTRDFVQLRFVGNVFSVTVTYGDEFLCIRNCDESDRWRTVDTVLSQNGGDFFKSWLTYIVCNSNYIKWFDKESYGKYSPDALKHYAFVTPNDIIEVLSLSEPKVEIQKLSLK